MFKCEHKDCEGKEREFKSPRALHVHEQMTHFGRKQKKSEITNPVCQMQGCGRMFETERALKGHFKHAHPEITKEWYAENFRTSEWVSCPICGKEYYRTLKAQRIGKNPTCGNRECYLKFVDQEKRETCLEKYGVDHQWKVPEIHDQCLTEEARENFKQSCLENFGYDNPLKNPEWHHNWTIENTYNALEAYKEKTGYSSPFANPEVREAFENKREEQTGYRNCLSNPEVRKQINETIDNKPGGRMAIIEKGQATYKSKTGYKCAFANPEVHKMIDDEREARTGYRNSMQNPEILQKVLKNENYINRKGRYKKGWYLSLKTQAWEFFESSYEYIRFLQLDDDKNVLYWHKNRSETLKYQKYIFETDSFKEAECVPDLYVVYIDSHIEIEELKGAELSVNTWLKADRIKAFCDENNIIFRYLVYNQIMSNEKWISLHDSFINNYQRENWRKENE
jgi:hypothetical protein